MQQNARRQTEKCNIQGNKLFSVSFDNDTGTPFKEVMNENIMMKKPMSSKSSNGESKKSGPKIVQEQIPASLKEEKIIIKVEK
jgi:hypothetical protein